MKCKNLSILTCTTKKFHDCHHTSSCAFGVWMKEFLCLVFFGTKIQTGTKGFADNEVLIAGPSPQDLVLPPLWFTLFFRKVHTSWLIRDLLKRNWNWNFLQELLLLLLFRIGIGYLLFNIIFSSWLKTRPEHEPWVGISWPSNNQPDLAILKHGTCLSLAYLREIWPILVLGDWTVVTNFLVKAVTQDLLFSGVTAFNSLSADFESRLMPRSVQDPYAYLKAKDIILTACILNQNCQFLLSDLLWSQI